MVLQILQMFIRNFMILIIRPGFSSSLRKSFTITSLMSWWTWTPSLILVSNICLCLQLWELLLTPSNLHQILKPGSPFFKRKSNNVVKFYNVIHAVQCVTNTEMKEHAASCSHMNFFFKKKNQVSVLLRVYSMQDITF